jgi:hypothetical protein
MLAHIKEADKAFQKLVNEKRAELDNVFSPLFLTSLQRAVDHEFSIGNFSKTANGQHYMFSNIIDLDIDCRRYMLVYEFLDKCDSRNIMYFIQSFVKLPEGIKITGIECDLIDRLKRLFAYDDYRTMMNLRSDRFLYVCCFLPIYLVARKRYRKAIDTHHKRISCKLTLEFSLD